MNLTEQHELNGSIQKIFKIFKHSDGLVRPHFILTGPSGSGKSHIVSTLAEYCNIDYLEINAAQLTREGTSGNSLAKVLTPLINAQNSLAICFVDEFDKLFVAGNSNDVLTHSGIADVQNEFLRIVEAETTSVFGDYGKYINISVKKVLFVFAGAFNGEQDITQSRLRELGVKTEFLGRVGIVLNTAKLSLEALFSILEQSKTLEAYMQIYPDTIRDDVVVAIKQFLFENHEKNDMGIRLVDTLIHQYFILGGKFKPLQSKLTRRRHAVNN